MGKTQGKTMIKENQMDDLMQMAREAGLFTHKEVQPELERFAELVRADEREACAKVVEASPSYDWHKFACEAAAAIRARSNT
jgi:hypothetical protein